MEIMKKIIIDKEVFEMFPDFKRGIIVVDGIENRESNSKIEELLKQEAEKRRGTFSNDPIVSVWDEVHRKFGSNPNRFPPSIKNLLIRIEKGFIPPFINSVVALFNYISLKYMIPCGGDDVEKVEGNLHLGLATGKEIFIGLGATENDPPIAGEVIYYDDVSLKIMCRRWNWRNGDFSKILPESKKIVINLDAIGPIEKGKIIEARDELAKILQEECSAKVKTDFLDINKKELEID